ncbi:MAG: branched-chain alpha-keto acid dehydrogenase subunit E2 [Curvibacter sp. GWA2_64_110]|nr:MAG: branched-chain alpha-keto acid dehydrogenase subunit E2 [Curvibacter sp. GWA2_64_110]HCY17021.1 2-oxo acid dehydrogenase subunit E2 [Curvibacter sp.]
MIEFKLPSLGADMEQGKLLQWHVKPGDAVQRGQVVAVVDTSKAAVDVEIWDAGLIHELRVQPGETVPVGAVLATLLAPGEAAPVAPPAQAAAKPAAVAAATRPAVSPSARRRAKELGIDAEALHGSGAQGAVTLADVEAAAAQRSAAAPVDRTQAMRRAIAAAMSRSKREIPHYYLSETIPMARALAWLQQHNEGLAITERILPAVLQLKAVALALQRVPQLNGFYRNDAFEPAAAVHTGVAIALRGGGLVAPALHEVGSKPLAQLMRELADLVQRARAGSLRSSEMSDPTITVTNLGDQGVEAVFGVIYPPQVALVGFGSVVVRPWVDGGELRAVPLLTASLAADHRVTDGHQGALFLAELRDLLQQPEQLAAADGGMEKKT